MSRGAACYEPIGAGDVARTISVRSDLLTPAHRPVNPVPQVRLCARSRRSTGGYRRTGPTTSRTAR